MDYVKPADVVDAMIQVGTAKAKLRISDMLIRGFLSGALLAYATSLAITANVQTGAGVVGGLVFPVGFVLIVLLGLELLTGNFALVPLGRLEGKASTQEVVSNFAWVLLGNLAGSVAYAGLLYVALMDKGGALPAGLKDKLIAAAQAKTVGYESLGASGWGVVLVKAVLCNWMVTLAAVVAMSSTSTVGKIAASWLPIFIFFTQGFEHLIVNFFLIPAGMMLGANVTISQMIAWNWLPVCLGNFAGGFLFTGLAIYWTHRKRVVSIPSSIPAMAEPSVRAVAGARVQQEGAGVP